MVAAPGITPSTTCNFSSVALSAEYMESVGCGLFRPSNLGNNGVQVRSNIMHTCPPSLPPQRSPKRPALQDPSILVMDTLPSHPMPPPPTHPAICHCLSLAQTRGGSKLLWFPGQLNLDTQRGTGVGGTRCTLRTECTTFTTESDHHRKGLKIMAPLNTSNKKSASR